MITYILEYFPVVAALHSVLGGVAIINMCRRNGTCLVRDDSKLPVIFHKLFVR